MVVPSRDLGNTLFLLSSNIQNYQQEHSLTQQMDIDIDMPRGQSKPSSPKIPGSYLSTLMHHPWIMQKEFEFQPTILCGLTRLKMEIFKALYSPMQWQRRGQLIQPA